VWTEERFAALRRLRESGLLLSGIFGLFWPLLLALELGLLARLLVSLIQFRSDKRWLKNGCFRRR
jgi:hypothetical protein